jgi:hypothetical protein
MAVQTQIQTRRGTAASWTSTNPTLAAGEFGYETDTGKFKIGNGSTAWASLAYTAAATAVTYLFNATSGQTTFSGADANGLTLAYTVGAEQVYLNGVLQVRGSDYTGTDGTSIVLASGALTSDVLNVIAYSAMTVTDTYTQAQADAKFYQLAFNGAAGKNAFINGACEIAQRGTAAVTLTAANFIYPVDRFFAGRSSGTTGATAQQFTSTGLDGFQYAVRVQRTAADTSTNDLYIGQSFETANSIPFANKAVVVSFWARAGANYSPTSSALNVRFYTGTGTDQSGLGSAFTGSATPISQTATLTTSWQRFQYTVTLASTATQMQFLAFCTPTGTAGAADNFDITGLQLEYGSIATPFARAGGTIAGELAACQRYYYRAGGDSLYQSFGAGATNFSGATSVFNINHPVAMRVAPTSLDSSSLANSDGSAFQSLSSLIIAYPGKISSTVSGTTSGTTAFRPSFIVTNNTTSGYIGFSAEL